MKQTLSFLLLGLLGLSFQTEARTSCYPNVSNDEVVVERYLSSTTCTYPGSGPRDVYIIENVANYSQILGCGLYRYPNGTYAPNNFTQIKSSSYQCDRFTYTYYRNQKPIVAGAPYSQHYNIAVNYSVNLFVDVSDPDYDVLSFSIYYPPSHGTVDLNEQTGAFTYTPATDYVGPDDFRVQVSDGKGGLAIAAVTFNIGNSGDVSSEIQFVDVFSHLHQVPQDSLIGFVLSIEGKDPYDEHYFYSFDPDHMPSHGNVVFSTAPGRNGTFFYTPDSDYLGLDTFGVTVSDGLGHFDSGVITVEVLPAIDPDKDGLTNSQEATYGTDPNDADTDDDNLNDGDEITLGTNPLIPDTDDDGLKDGVEITFGSDPLVKDSDADGMLDNFEYIHGFDPNDPADAGFDSDVDNLINVQEFELNTDPHNPDTDNDGVSDGDEVTNGTNPLFNVAAFIAILSNMLH